VKHLALLACVVALVAAMFYAAQGSSKAEATKSAEGGTAPTTIEGTNVVAVRKAAPSAPSAPPSASVVDPRFVEHANIAGLPEELEPGYLAIEHAAKTCYRGRKVPKPTRPNGPDETVETIKISYRQLSDQGVGHVEDLTVTRGQFTDQKLQACIVKAMTAATWTSAAPDGVIGEMEQEVNLGDLLRPDFKPPPAVKTFTAPAPQQPEVDEHPGVVVPARQP
jgi:hypothetical protein